MASPYDDRPWLALYDPGVPPAVDLPNPSALAMFDAALAQRPDAPLAHYFDTTLTWKDVDSMAAALAVGLADDLGIRRGDRVVVQLQVVPGFLLAMLPLWRLGAVMVPVNPMYKQRELEVLLRDSGAKALDEAA
jgi:long-chain acyl-CoA synthetase